MTYRTEASTKTPSFTSMLTTAVLSLSEASHERAYVSVTVASPEPSAW